MNHILITALTKILAKYSLSDIERMAKEIIGKFFPNLKMPVFRIVHHTLPKYLGKAKYRAKYITKGDGRKELVSKIIVEIQNSILDDERTLFRTVAHELIHVWQYNNPDVFDPSSGRFTHGENAHGKAFTGMAANMNAVYGPDYVTETSDALDVISQEKEFFIIIQPHEKTNKFGMTKVVRPSKEQKIEIADRIQNKKAHVFKTKDATFETVSNIKQYGGYSVFKNDEAQSKIADIYQNHKNYDALFIYVP